jgi:hypothetical protein
MPLLYIQNEERLRERRKGAIRDVLDDGGVGGYSKRQQKSVDFFNIYVP